MYFYLSLLRRWSLQLGLLAAIVGSAIASASLRTQAQVVPDNTLGTENSAVTNAGNVDTISGGATREGNLFHSFQQFSVQNGRTAQFDNAASIQNIITRVTGGSVSNIDGTLAARGTANLFLLNPNGIVFGQNARLDIGGSFIGTTARSINFADGTQFSATPGSGAPLLTVNVPIGLQFGTGAGNIVNRASNVGLQVQPGRTLGLVSGNVNLAGGILSAAGGRVELGAVAAPGVVGLNTDNTGFRFSFPTDLALADISLTNGARVDVSAGGGGTVGVNVRNLRILEGSEIAAGIGENQGSVGAQAGDIEVNAQDTVTIDGADSQGFPSRLLNNLRTGGTGKGGNVNIRTASLQLTNGGTIAATTFGNGDAGSVNITASDAVSIDGLEDAVETGIFSRVRETASGKAGEIAIQARSLSMANNGQLDASTLGQGNAGSISLQVDSAISLSNSYIFSDVAPGAVGNGGTIDLKAQTLSITDGAQILSALENAAPANGLRGGRGNSGKITIDVGDAFSISGRSSDGILPSGVFTTVGSGAEGKGGDISITAGSLSLADGARLNANTFGQGDAGSVTITADDRVSLDNSRVLSNVLSESTGKGGDVSLKARSLSLTNGARISASTFGLGQGSAGNIQVDVSDSVVASGGSILSADSFNQGNSGNVTIVAGGSVSFDGVGTDALPGGVFSQLAPIAEFQGERRGGSINIEARSLSLSNGAQLATVSLGQGNAGSIQIDTTDSVDINSAAALQSFSSDKGNAGSVMINAGGLVSFDGANSRVSSFLLSQPESQGEFRAGDISIKARSLSLTNGARLSTDTPSGQGNAGNIRVDATDDISISGGSDLSLFSGGRGNSGNLTITAGNRISLDNSQIFSILGLQGIGKGGDVFMKARSLSLANGAEISTSTLGQGDAGSIQVEATDNVSISGSSLRLFSSSNGNAGNVIVDAGDRISLDNSRVVSELFPGGRGRGGDVRIQARSLSLINGAQLSTSTFGQGNAGEVFVQVDDSISLANSSFIFSNVETGGVGNGGTVNINAQTLSLTDGAQIQAGVRGASETLPGGRGNGGQVTIDLRGDFNARGRDNNGFSSGVFTSVGVGAEGRAGDIEIGAGSISLDEGTINAQTASGDGGNIRLQTSNMRLRNSSRISTSAGGTEQPGNGGNITIDAPIVIANFNGNNDITANAFRGNGGRIEINAQSIFGLTPRTRQELQTLLGTDTPTAEDFLNSLNDSPTNDVAAISLSDPSLSGTVSFNAADIDPSRDVVELPSGLVDASALVAAGCPSRAENRFAITGRGGLPPAPGNKLSTDAILTDWASLPTSKTNRAAVKSPEVANATPNSIVEATTWQFSSKGEIVLTANTSNTSNGFGATPTSCSGS